MIFIDYYVLFLLLFELNYYSTMILESPPNIITAIQKIDICFANIELLFDIVDD
jgi:hypothetical protein